MQAYSRLLEIIGFLPRGVRDSNNGSDRIFDRRIPELHAIEIKAGFEINLFESSKYN